VRYAADRRQFGRPIASFGAIAQKLGDMIARQYALEAMLYRTAGLIDGKGGQPRFSQTNSSDTMLAALEEFAIESSIVKVAGSETADFIFDENVQIHGGNGFVRDYPAERRYRDARVNRIFEGTNEINRLIIPSLAIRRATKGALPLERGQSPLIPEMGRRVTVPLTRVDERVEWHQSPGKRRPPPLLALGFDEPGFVG
jgi:alkylation response protein AidB-like acyl-CoA dehydrogenase